MSKECDSSLLHNQVENKIKIYLKDRGFVLIDNSYHHNLEAEQENALKSCNSLTAFQYRTEPDYLVIGNDTCFYLEIKSGEVKDNEICIEAYPFICSKMKQEYLDTDIFYAVYTNGILKIKSLKYVKIPEKVIIPKVNKNKKLVPLLKANFKEVKYIDWNHNQNEKSGDAFTILNIKDWEERKI